MPRAAVKDLKAASALNQDTSLAKGWRSQLPPTMAAAAASVGYIDWAYLAFLFTNISPYFWSSIGIALCVGLSILGAAW